MTLTEEDLRIVLVEVESILRAVVRNREYAEANLGPPTELAPRKAYLARAKVQEPRVLRRGGPE